MAEYLEIPVEGKYSGLSLLIYPQSPKAKVFEEREPYAGESRWQLMEGCTYAYEFVPFETAQTSTGCRYQFERENEIVRFHPNKTSHAWKHGGLAPVFTLICDIKSIIIN